MANYDENNKGSLSREHFRKKLAGLTFPLTFNSKRKAMLSAIYTIRAEEPNSVIVSASTATQEYRFLVKSLNHESHTDPEAYPDSDAEGRYFPKETINLSASIDLIKVRSVIKYYTQKPEDNFTLSASLDAIKIREVVKYLNQPQEDTYALTASIDNIKVRSVVVFHTQPMEDTFNLSSKVEQARSVKIFNSYIDSTETCAVGYPGNNRISSDEVTVAVPSAARIGDVLIAVLVTSSNTNVTSSGWVNEFSASPSNTVRIFTRVWDGEATSYTFTLGATGKWTVYCYIAKEYIKYDYTTQTTRNYTPSTGNELRIIGYDSDFKLSEYSSNDITLVAPLGGERAGYTKYIDQALANPSLSPFDGIYRRNGHDNNVELAGIVNKLPITSLDPIDIEVEYPNQNITKQFMIILETRKASLVFPPTNLMGAYSDS